jgi:hypothetical protein
MRQGVLTAILAVALMAALAGAAQADIRFKGTSGQGRTVNFRTNDAGLMERFAISWRGDCRRPGYSYVSGTKTTPRSPLEVSTRNRWLDVGGYRQRLRGRKLAIYRARAVGRRVSEHRWRGVFRITVRVFRRGRQIDRCHVRTGWRVRRLPG